MRKILNLRLFDEGDKRWRKSVKDEDLEVLCVSQVQNLAFAFKNWFLILELL